MPKAIMAMRSYPATFALALLLFLLTLIITTGSLGKVLSGGDGGDGGSGMGGTGKSGEFGGSGFGGTGGPSPFFTNTDAVDDQSRDREQDDSDLPVQVELPTTLIAQDPVPESAAESVKEAAASPLEELLEQHPMVEETRQEIAQEVPTPVEETPVAESPAPVIQVVEAAPEPRQIPEASEQAPLQLAPTPMTEPQKPAIELAAVPEEPATVETFPSEPAEDVQQLAETIAVKLDSEADEEEPDRERPDRIQRPDLPPFQRIRPIERPALLPPRVQPMRI